MKKWAIGLLLILFASSVSLGQGQEKAPNPGKLYDAGTELFHRGRYEEAASRFFRLIQTFPTSRLVSYSQYMIGQCHLKMEKYEEAIQQFELYLKTYPEGDRVKEAEEGGQMSRERLKEKIPPRSLQATAPMEETKVMSAVSKNPTQLEGKSPEVREVKRRVCAQVFYFDGKDLGEVEKRVRALKNAGVDTLILRVFQNRGDRMYKFVTPRHEEGVYFQTDYAPVVDDVLGKLAEIVHRNGLDIFAWMTTRYANYGLQGRPEFQCKRYNFETKKIEMARGLNLFHPDVLRRLEGLFRDLGRYPIDGILFQDDLILRHNEDFGTEANKAYLKEFGYLPHPDLLYVDPYKSESGKYYVKAYTDQFWQWAHWKNRWLMNVAKQLMAAAKESNPTLRFGINLYYESILNHSNSVAWFSQTLSEALEKNFDYYAIMAYHRQTMKELNLEEKRAIDLMAEVAEKAVKSVGDPSRVLMKVQILDWKSYEVIPTREVEAVLDEILRHGKVSLAFVPYIDQFPLHKLKGKWTTK